MATIETLKGFRDFYPEECTLRNYVFNIWREVARRYGFVEYEAPLLESTDLYRKKSGDEIAGQLFSFIDQGGRDVALRPELTPSLARMVGARQRDFAKPIKWFEIGQCFRGEKPSRGRGREFYQWNLDIVGEAGDGADAELIALAIEAMLLFGFDEEDFAVRVSDRRIWDRFMTDKGIEGDQCADFLRTIDKWEKASAEKLDQMLAPFGLNKATVETFMEEASAGDELAPVLANLEARGLADFVRVDPTIVRGLAYYTGVVFEVFDLKLGLRAVAGGGRYDGLCKLINPKADLPSVGFAMGDMVISEMIKEHPVAQEAYQEAVGDDLDVEVYVVIADEEKRPEALGFIQDLRSEGIRTDAPLSATKVGKQFSAAENSGAPIAVVIGSEYPTIKVKFLADREEIELNRDDALTLITSGLPDDPDEEE